MKLYAVVEHTQTGYCDSCASCQTSFFGVFSTKDKAMEIVKQNTLNNKCVVEIVLDEPVRDYSIY